jgi:tetratricopeptide (TPR) repeat protein
MTVRPRGFVAAAAVAAVAAVVAAGGVVACRGEPRGEPSRTTRGTPAVAGERANATGTAAIVEGAPVLPPSPDGIAELRAIDERIEIHRDEPEIAIPLLLDRAWIRGRLDDYVAAAERSAAWVARAPGLAAAWQIRVQVLTRVHEFAAARAALDRLRPLVRDGGETEGLAAAIDEATGAASAAPYRERMARDYPDPTTLTRWATSLAEAGRIDEALAVMQKVPATIHDNPPQLLAWILFQWGRLHERKGQLASARACYEASRARLPTIDATVHLAQAIAATGGDPGALVTAALVDNRHPELLALAGQGDEARQAWEARIAALPRAFAGGAARFYLDGARDPGRALALARLDRDNRDTGETRLLVVEAALTAGDAAAACQLAPALAAGPAAQQFAAWRAFSACGRTIDAAALAARLGIR